jgi:hypothetical protein
LTRKQNKLVSNNPIAVNNNSQDPVALAVSNYLRLASKNRRPGSMVPRTAATIIKKSSTYNAPNTKPPYNQSSIDRFEDTFRSDKLIQNGIVKRTELVIGKHGRIVLDTTEEFDDQDDRIEALSKIQKNAQYQQARKKIQQLLTKPAIDFHNKLKAAVIQCKVYGRAAIEIVGDNNENGLPVALHVLNSKRIGNVEIDPITWEFLGCHYLDLEKGPSGMDDILTADQLIYFTNRDFHVSPGSLYYGLSELEGVIDGSDSKRIAKQEDIKEIMKSNWAPFLIMKFINPNVSVQQMQEIVSGLQPGLPFAHKQDIDTQAIDLTGDLKKLTEAIDFLNRESMRELGVPAFLAGYEQIANYANSQQVLLAFKEIELDADRTWIKDIIQPQWLNKLFYSLLGIDQDSTTTEQADVKLSYEFEDITFETNLDKINASLLLYDRQLISGEKVLRIASYEDEIEEYKLRKEEIERQQQLILSQKQQNRHQMDGEGEEDEQNGAQDSENGNKGDYSIDRVNEQVSTTYRKRQANLYKKFEETLDAIKENG